ncbi:MAG: hypothetical protein GY777_28610 [Candidatus Brocadiaceae bacterium]|nr:hypothetical protein [Candidatus Brocadiaceae bacterium]
MKDSIKCGETAPRKKLFSRLEALKAVGMAGLLAALLIFLIQNAFAVQAARVEKKTPHLPHVSFPDWTVEALIGGLTISGVNVDTLQTNLALDQAVKQGVTVIEADSRLSDYLTEEDFVTELKCIKDTTELIHERGLKVVWYIPALEVITPNGRINETSFAREHPDWLQTSFDGERRAFFYGTKVFWVMPDDESAWLCPNSPYREWFKGRLRRLAETGIDGLWLDVPIFDQIAISWGCSCKYCREKFKLQTGMEFPRKFGVTDKRFWRWVQWRHEILTEFLDDCRNAVISANPDTVTIAEVVSLDHMGSTVVGSEGSTMVNSLIVWEVDALSESTSMAEASYDDWIAMYNIYKYCRGATMDSPSWAFCYGYNESDAQLVMSSAIAAQNNPYELREPEMTSTVSSKFRSMMFNWIGNYSEQIYRSQSLAPVAVVYSERNRDFLDALHEGGIFFSPSPPGRDRKWLGKKKETPLRLQYMGDYRGLSILLYQHQIPADIYPFSRVNEDLLNKYKVIVLPYMAILTEAEKDILLKVVQNGATLIVSGPKPGMWNADGDKRKESLWADILQGSKDKRITRNYGKGRICFWKDHVGRNYLKGRDNEVPVMLLSWLKDAGVDPWVNEKQQVVVQPYVYENQTIIHVLNYSWVGKLENKPKPLSLELCIPWDSSQMINNIIQSEPQWDKPKDLTFFSREGKLVIPIEVGINALVVINKK